MGPRRALDTLISVLGTSEGNFATEVRINVCRLFGYLGRRGVVREDRQSDVERLKNSTRELLQNIAMGLQVHAQALSEAAKRALEAWAQ